MTATMNTKPPMQIAKLDDYSLIDRQTLILNPGNDPELDFACEALIGTSVSGLHRDVKCYRIVEVPRTESDEFRVSKGIGRSWSWTNPAPLQAMQNTNQETSEAMGETKIFEEFASRLNDIARRCGVARTIDSVRLEIQQLANWYSLGITEPTPPEPPAPAEASGEWRILTSSEIIEPGDEFQASGFDGWSRVHNDLFFGKPVSNYQNIIFRRRIPAPVEQSPIADVWQHEREEYRKAIEGLQREIETEDVANQQALKKVIAERDSVMERLMASKDVSGQYESDCRILTEQLAEARQRAKKAENQVSAIANELHSRINKQDAEVAKLRYERDRLSGKLSELDAAYNQVVRERTTVMRTYDPNCDEYVFEDEIEKMKGARQHIDAMQELATELGRDPEGCLIDCVDEVLGRVEQLQTLLDASERVRKVKEAELAKTTETLAGMTQQAKLNQAELDRLRNEINKRDSYARNDYWSWMENEPENCIDSLTAHTPVLIRGRQIQEIIKQRNDAAAGRDRLRAELAAMTNERNKLFNRVQDEAGIVDRWREATGAADPIEYKQQLAALKSEKAEEVKWRTPTDEDAKQRPQCEVSQDEKNWYGAYTLIAAFDNHEYKFKAVNPGLSGTTSGWKYCRVRES